MNVRKSRFILLCCAVLSSLSPSALAGPPVDFNRDIQPIFSDKCFACHGPDANARKAKLRLDERAGALKVIVPGKPEESTLIERVSATDAGEVMPPPKTGKHVSQRERALLKQWIAEGAAWQAHWAYTPPIRPPVPEVKDRAWPINAIDAFLLARLEKNGLQPSAEAERRTLMRRLSFDLTGLPPAPGDVDRFVHATDPGSYENLVDAYLASPRYAERMAGYWLDLVRYADSVGYHGDSDNFTIWPYRDYVIHSFRENMPFDRFTREQLAGDLLPNATRAQQIASGYNRLGMMSTEGGVQDKEYRAKYAADRVRNASSVWLGSTLGCAECHDHKFDPFKTKDFYRLAAFFADLKEEGYYKHGFDHGDWGPKLRLSTPEQEARLAELDAKIAGAKKRLEAVTNDALAEARAQWETETLVLDKEKIRPWTAMKPLAAESAGGATLTIRPNNTIFVDGKLPLHDTYVVTIPAELERITALRLVTLSDESLPGNRKARAGYFYELDEVEVEVVRADGSRQPVQLADADANQIDEGFPPRAAIDGDPRTAWAVPNNHSREHRLVLHFAQPIQGGPEMKLVVRLRQAERYLRHTIGWFKLELSGLSRPHLPVSEVPAQVMQALRKPAGKRTDAENKLLADYYRTVAPATAELRLETASLEAERSLLLGSIPTTLVSALADRPREVRVLPRGDWMNDSGELVSAGPPLFLKQPSGDRKLTRLDLADWLTARDNPLTARVFVNRLWKMYFGVGLSKTLDDFGARGERPVHPQLLDWLAVEFMESGWNVKHTIKLMVMSRAYRQTSLATPELLAKDPFNRLVARQSAFRLDAEFIRDNALAVSGLLVEQVGGPSVRPPQPPGYWAALNFPKREWSADVGERQYRRGLYTHWQRTFLHPSLLAFDASTREECLAQRVPSNTPLQALVLLNDPIYVEAARVFAGKIVRASGASAEERLTWAFRRALARDPRPVERKLLADLHAEQLARYKKDLDAARELTAGGATPAPSDVDVPELAAWTTVARALLNLHETITRN